MIGQYGRISEKLCICPLCFFNGFITNRSFFRCDYLESFFFFLGAIIYLFTSYNETDCLTAFLIIIRLFKYITKKTKRKKEKNQFLC